MVRAWLAGGLAMIVGCSLAGCASMRGNTNLETQGLRNRVSVLENELASKNAEVVSLRASLNTAIEDRDVQGNRGIIKENKERMSVRDIQEALAKAGYNVGVADGRMGAKTREAIRAFQKDNGLKVDGKVGKQTGNLLQEHLKSIVK